MGNFTLQQDRYVSNTSVPNCFIEQFMPYASGEFVKIYIYILKCASESRSELSISKIADVFNNTEKDVVRALKYWQKKGLLKLTFDEENALTSLYIVSLTDTMESDGLSDSESVTLNVTDAPVPGNPANNIKHGMSAAMRRKLQEETVHTEEKQEADAKALLPARKEYSKDEIDAFSKRDDVAVLLFIAEKYLGRTLSGQDVNTVFYMVDSLGFDTDLIEYLFEYCVGKNKRNIRYIEKIAINWAEQGIKTVSAAKATADMYSDECYKVMNAFGLNNRQPTKTETDYVTRWKISYGFDSQLIVAACSKTMDKLHQPSFEYTDAILKNWKGRGVLSMDDVEKLDQEFEYAAMHKEKKTVIKPQANKAVVSSKFNNFHQRTYDYQELEQKLFKK